MDNQHLTIAKVIIFLGLGLCIYLLSPKVQESYNVYRELQTKISDVSNKKTQIKDIKDKKVQYEQAEKVTTKPVYKNDTEVTDNMSSFGVMFEDIIQSAKYNGLKLRSIEYNENPVDDSVQVTMPEEYNVCAIKMQLVGSYMQFRSYFQDIYNYPYVVNLDKISIKPYEKNKKVLIANVVVTLYSTKTSAQKEAYKAAKELENSENKEDKKSSDSGLAVNVPQN